MELIIKIFNSLELNNILMNFKEIELINRLNKYSLEDILKIEESDRQFIALKKLSEKIWNKDYFLPIVLSNSIICYQLSSTWENYWEELSDFWIKYNFSQEFSISLLKNFFDEFLSQTSWNKRLLEPKKKRLYKFFSFIEIFENKKEFYKDNLEQFLEDISRFMNQKQTDKTMVFAIKMYSYAARIYYKKQILVPFSIAMPEDSRITKITEIYNNENKKFADFWFEISREVWIPCIHLDALLWCNCDDFLK